MVPYFQTSCDLLTELRHDLSFSIVSYLLTELFKYDASVSYLLVTLRLD